MQVLPGLDSISLRRRNAGILPLRLMDLHSAAAQGPALLSSAVTNLLERTEYKSMFVNSALAAPIRDFQSNWKY